MAFVGVQCSTFLGSKASLRSVCRLPVQHAAFLRTARMTVAEPVSPAGPFVEGNEQDPVLLPRVNRLPLKKGQQFSFVRYQVDDFEPAPYFEGLTGEGVKVAVLDTGCDPNHPALKGRIDMVNSKNYTTNDNGDPKNFFDDNRRNGQLIGHGTHCCGIVAAEPQKAVMYGVAPGATLLVKKVLENSGGGPGAGPIEWTAAAIRDSVREGANVISMSLGFPDIFQRWYPAEMGSLYRAVQEALAADVTVVVAAGNSGTFDTSNTITQPGSYGGVITVASHDDNGNRSVFSSYGGELDMMGPGEVISTRPGGGYHALAGTSMATPLVAGLAALLIEAGRKSTDELSAALAWDMRRTGYRARTPYEIREMLRNLCERPDEHSRVDGYGRLVRAYKLVKGEVEEDM